MRSTPTLLLLLVALFCRPARAQEATRVVEFNENKGQWDARARYGAHVATGAWLFAESTGLTYALVSGLPDHAPHPAGAKPAPAFHDQLPSHGLRVEFVQPEPNATLLAEEQAAGRQHYLRGNDPTRWAADVRTFHQLRYRALWPGTDLVLHENPSHQLEYDLLLAPGASPARARLRYRGADALRLDPATGNLLVRTAAGPLTEQRPRAWQTDVRGQRQPVTCAFELRGSEVSFRVGKYDRRRPLVIDPVVRFSSYTGSTVENWGFAGTSDAAGNMYSSGVVFEPGYPTTTGAYQTSFRANTDIALMKFNTAVSGPGARVWATHLGGNGLEFPHSLLVSGSGELLVLGSTSSTDYPTTSGAALRSFQGGSSIAPYGVGSAFVLANGSDLFLTRLSASGSLLQASTYLGGPANDGLLDPAAAAPNLRYNYGDAFRGDLALDAAGNVYVASVTSSATFPGLALPLAYRGGTSDALVASLDASLGRVRWASLLGGTGADAAYSLQRHETTGELLVAGGTSSPTLPLTTGSYQPAPGGSTDGFVASFSATGTLGRCTYLGTAAPDQAYFVRRNGSGEVYVLGQTLANAWPGQTPGAYANARGHQFIQQLAPDLRTAGFGTVFGGGQAVPNISPTAFEVDCYGRVFLAGWGGGLDPNNGSTLGLPVTTNALQPASDGMDFYLMQLSDGARTLDYASFFGTSADDHVDGGTSRFDPQGTLYQAMCACNQSGAGLPIPAGANYYSPLNGSAHCNNAAFKFAFTAGSTPAGPDTLTVCARAGAIALGGSPAGGTWTGPLVSGSVAAGYFFTPDTAQLGTFLLTYTSPLTGLCAGTSVRRITVAAQLLAQMQTPPTTICLQPGGPVPVPIPLRATPAGGVFVGVGVVNGSPPVFDPVRAGPGSHLIRYVLPGSAADGRCAALASVTINVQGLRILDLGPPLVVCANDPPQPLSGNPGGGTWSGPGVVMTSAGNYAFVPSVALIGRHALLYSFTGTLGCSGARDTLYVRVRAVAGTVAVPPDTVLCASGAPFRLRGGVPAGGTWSGPGVTGTRATGFTFTPSPALIGVQSVLYTGVVVDTSQCPARAGRGIRLNAGVVRLSMPRQVLCPAAGPQRLSASPAGGVWVGPGVSGNATAGYFFTPSPALIGAQTLSYTSLPSSNPSQCPGADTLQATVVAPPLVRIDSLPSQSFCAGVPPHGEVLTAQPAGGIFGGPGVVGNRFNPALAGPGRHVLTYTIRFMTCTLVATTVAEVTQLTAIRLPADTVLCLDQTPFRLRAAPAGGTWSGPGVTAAGVFTPPASPGTSVLIYALPGGCGTAPYRVTVPVEPTFSARWTAPDCAGTNLAPRLVRFAASGPAAGQVQWDFGDGSPLASGAVVEHTYLAGGRYPARAALPLSAGPGGPCARQVALLPVEVQASVVPNIITPNGDGENDAFAPRIGGCPGRLQVFSRWGQPVFDSPVYHNEWGGAGLPAGLYYYLLGGNDGTTRVKGWVEVVR